MTKVQPLMLVSWLLGCNAMAGIDDLRYTSSPEGSGGDAGSGGTGGSSSGTGGSSSGTGGSSSGTGGSASGGPPDLVNGGLIVRYFIDEVADGQQVQQLVDSAPNPLPLNLNYDGSNLAFTEVGGNRGLHWSTAGSLARASVLVTDTKIQSALTDAGAVTIEVVVDVDSVVNTARISHIGQDTDDGHFTLAWDGTDAQYWQNGAYNTGRWNVSLNMMGRVVVHLVMDILQEEMTQRTRLYVDGSLVTPNDAPMFPGTNTPLLSPSGKHYVLGNWEAGGRSFQGTLYYAAMYGSALSQSEISQNAAELLVNDDSF